MRLTPDVVSKTPSHLNALKERELDLRGLQIPVIENLASHQGTYDTLNLTDNSLTVLGNIPLSTRLQALHVGRNQISSISVSLPANIPNLVTLVLSDNVISSLATLAPLESLTHLQHLSLTGNPITQHEHYRLFVIWKVGRGSLRTLDFKRIKDSERAAAKKLFVDSTTSLPNALANRLSTSTAAVSGSTGLTKGSAGGAGAAGGGPLKGGKGRLMTPEEKKKVVEALTRAKTADQVRKLERMLAEGLIPEGEEGVPVNGS
ncbi:leucine-rich repeat-domain-containing protein [Kockovaella imperatae]|uniref:U2 small nuclear ribonucleoprotein A' n=1 Tax=Kockovaella imperatae TaxID=4999 RepID=A0A1Y1UNQ1_9TREE|nr:leucine-rich repeat-domain-containing protein [Kockovaella imperatae]ORX39167.1 leucine-rich repeat-domain-containing protein [Kockovaella imperatae]